MKLIKSKLPPLWLLATAVAILMPPHFTCAHFPWIVLPEPGSREFSVVFSEGPWPDDPQYLARVGRQPVTVWMADGTQLKIDLQPQDDRLVGTLPTNAQVVALTLPVDWGVISRGGSSFMLRYWAIGVVDLEGFSQLNLPASNAPSLAVNLPAVNKIELAAYAGRQPLGDAKIKLVTDSLSDELTTDSAGKTLWNLPEKLDDDLIGCYLNTETNETGEYEGQSYSQVKNYLTTTFRFSSAVSLPRLPEGITSFGAARYADAIYVYGGHTGEAHHYWNTSQSNELLKWDLNSPNPEWEVIAQGPRLQGLGMVAYQHYLIIVGGFTATNERDQAHHLVSQTDVKVFDTQTGQWTDDLNLPNLPNGRSSHDAMVIGDRLYVVGGWRLEGDETTQWHDTALVIELDSQQSQWEELPTPDFQRRAVTLANFQDRLWVIGGMDRNSGPTLAVSVFDPQTQTWSSAPDLIGESGMNGFGVAAWNLNGQLVVTAHDGSIQVLSNDQQQWESKGYTQDSRFFHRMLPFDNRHLVTLGGACMQSGKFLVPELVSLD